MPRCLNTSPHTSSPSPHTPENFTGIALQHLNSRASKFALCFVLDMQTIKNISNPGRPKIQYSFFSSKVSTAIIYYFFNQLTINGNACRPKIAYPDNTLVRAKKIPHFYLQVVLSPPVSKVSLRKHHLSIQTSDVISETTK